MPNAAGVHLGKRDLGVQHRVADLGQDLADPAGADRAAADLGQQHADQYRVDRLDLGQQLEGRHASG